MQKSFQEIIKEKTGVEFSEIIEGYDFVGKNEEYFVFENKYQETINLTIEALRSEIRSKVKEKEEYEVYEKLRKKGIFRVNFDLFNLNNQLKETFHIINVENESDLIVLENLKHEKRIVHFSLLQNEQTQILIDEAKTLEESFNELELKYILKRIKEICEQVFHPTNQSTKVSNIHPTLLRLKVLILGKLESQEIDLNNMTPQEILELKEEIEFSISLVDPSNHRLLKAFRDQINLLNQKIETINFQSELEKIDRRKFHPIFEIDLMKAKILQKINLNNQTLTQILQDTLISVYVKIESITGMTFKRTNIEILNLQDFLDSLENLHSRYVNTQLKIGYLDSMLITRFQVETCSDRQTYGILENYDNITESEKLALLNELIEHRLLLLFQNAFNSSDQYFKDLAQNNVLEFYKIFYEII